MSGVRIAMLPGAAERGGHDGILAPRALARQRRGGSVIPVSVNLCVMFVAAYRSRQLRASFGMALASLAIVALLISQAGLVWHAFEHLALAAAHGEPARLSLSIPADLTDTDKSPAEGACLKCLEGSSHSTALTGIASTVILHGVHVLAAIHIPADSPAPVQGQPRQRGPPAFSI